MSGITGEPPKYQSRQGQKKKKKYAFSMGQSVKCYERLASADVD